MKRNDGVSTIAYNMNIEIDLKSLLSNCFHFMVPISLLVTYIDGPHCKGQWAVLATLKSSQDPVVVIKFEFCAHSARLLRKLDHVFLWILSNNTGL